MAKKHKKQENCKISRIPLDDYQKGWVRKANDNLLLFNRHTNHNLLMQQIFDEADLVQAIIRDDNQPTGLGFVMVKGRESLRAAMDRQEAWHGRVTAVIAKSYEHAEAFRLVFGDGKQDAAND